MTNPHAEVIGDPIAHSKSPMIHGFWLEKLGLTGDYRKTHVRDAELGDFFAARRKDPDWRGCNVTVPHKQAVMPHLDEVDADAAAIGAVNTVVNEGGRLIGRNTDVTGIEKPLGRLLGPHAALSDPVVLIGAGGAARAAIHALGRLFAGDKPELVIVNRSMPRAQALLAEFGWEGAVLPLGGAIPPTRLLLNASSLGMTGQPPLPANLNRMHSDGIVFDFVYAPLDTELLIEARRRGLHVIDGLTMLIGQAERAFEHFFGSAPPARTDAELRALLTA